jgi:glycosyltransferase involved in cell wall biosynthesis
VNLITITVSTFVAALRNFKSGDYVLAVTNPPSSPFFVALACKIKRARFLLRIEDVYPEAMVAAGLMRSDAYVTRLADWLTRRLYGAAERVIVLGRDMGQIVARRLNGDSGRAIHISNWAETIEVVPRHRHNNPLLKELGLTDKFVIQFSGTMGRTHGVETLIEAAEMLRNSEHIHFLFIGSGNKKGLVDRAASSLRNVTVLPIRPRSELVISLNACDLAIVSLISGMTGVSVPSRTYNILAAGKPLIAVADQNSEVALLVKEGNLGWVVAPRDPSAIRDAILEASSQPARLMEMGLRARRLAEEYSKERILERYSALFRDLEASIMSQP